MIEINLLPEAMRKKKMNAADLGIEMDKVRILAGCAFIGVLIIVIVFLSIGSFIRRRQVARLKAKEVELMPQRSRVEVLDKEVSILKVKMAALYGVTKRDFLWARKLNEFSDLILPGIWFRRIYIDTERENNLVAVEGSVISKREEAIDSVGKLMNNLKGNESFFKDFSNIKLESVQRKSVEERDVVDFRLVLSLER